ncbi:ribosome-binding factor A, partial [Paenibacillus sp. 2TAB19]
MAKIRVGRVSEQIKKELSQIIQMELKDPRIGFITVTGVETTSVSTPVTV